MKRISPKNKKVILILILTALLVYDINLLDRYIDIKMSEITASAVSRTSYGQISFCFNNPPILDTNSPQNVTAREPFSMYVHAADSNGDDFAFSLNDTSFFNLVKVNSTSALIEFTPVIADRGNYSYLISVNDDSSCGNNYASGVLNLNIIGNNSPPQFIGLISDQAWWQRAGLSNAFDLDDYFSDPDGDPLSYSYTESSNIRVTIDSNNIVSFGTKNDLFFGSETMQFIASDTVLTNISNIITLTVMYVPLYFIDVFSVGGGGGGGGAGYTCEENWTCSAWGPCSIEGITTRTCIDLNDCGANQTKPSETKSCVYIPTCYDGIQNQGEEGIDCGGPCPPCETCYDGIKNQGEEGIDCGGPCPPCPSCSDGIQNQGEEGVDCGGPCSPCKERLAPIALIKKEVTPLNLFLILLIILLILLPSSGWTYVKIKRSISGRTENMILRLRTEIYRINKEIVVKHLLKRLEYLEKSISRENTSIIAGNIFSIIKTFIKEYFNIGYEFTSEDLSRELSSRRLNKSLIKVLVSYFNQVHYVVYGGYSVSLVELRTLVHEAKSIISVISGISLGASSYTRININQQNKLHLMHNKIRLSLDYLAKKELKKSKAVYIGILREYERLSANKKKKIREYIFRLYNLISFRYKKWKNR